MHWGYSVHYEENISAFGGHHYCCGTPPNELMISLSQIMISSLYTDDIPQCTDNIGICNDDIPHCTDDIPQCTDDLDDILQRTDGIPQCTDDIPSMH